MSDEHTIEPSANSAVETSGSCHFDSYTVLHEKVCRLVQASALRIDIFDPSGRDLALGSSEFADLAHGFLLKGGQMNIVVHDTAYIEGFCPRLQGLLRYRGHQIAIHRTSDDLHHLQESLLIGDDQHLLRRFHSDYARGELVLADGEAARPWRSRFQGIWDSSSLAVSFSTLGL